MSFPSPPICVVTVKSLQHFILLLFFVLLSLLNVSVVENEDVAVKKLWPTKVATRYDCRRDRFGINAAVRDSFSAKVKTLGSIRHKNIVRFLGCCWNRNTRLLMYEYMPNGSLRGLLHERSGNCLEWELRYRIVLGAAQGLVTCTMIAFLRLFTGTSRPITSSLVWTLSLALLILGLPSSLTKEILLDRPTQLLVLMATLLLITEKSDVYSYGVVVLELLTGKQPQPIDPTILDKLHIVDWVRQNRGGVEVLDQILRPRPESEIEEMLQTLGVALLCINSTPDDRPTMKDVAAMFKEIRQEREREECMKVNMLRNSSSENGGQENNITSSNGGSSLAMTVQQHPYSSSTSTSFSASSLLYTSPPDVNKSSK